MVKSSEQVLFVVLNFKGWQETITCIDAILEQSYKSFHIMLIENGSGDDSVEKLSHYEKNAKITFVKNSKNRGFSGGVNMGIQYAIANGFPYVALLNNDAFITKDWLERLVTVIRSTKASIVTGLLLSGDGKKIESTGDSYSYWGLPFPRQRDESTDQAEDSGYVFGGTAGASLYKTELFKDIGLFDEKFFAYFEDTDICYRAQLAGHKAYYEKTAIAYHDHGTTSRKIPGFTVHQTFQNLPIFFWKNTPLVLLLPVGIRLFSYYLSIYVRAILRGQFIVASKGVLRSILHFPYALRKRHDIQRKRQVSIAYLRSVIYPHLPPIYKQKIRAVFQSLKS